MSTLRIGYHLMRADILESVRRNSFLVVLAITVYGCYIFVPPSDGKYVTLAIGTTRGIYNSPWVGIMFGFSAATFLPLFGFFLIKNTINHDRQTRVGQIIATTPLSKATYMLGKWLGNLALFILILVVLAMQIYRAEDLTIQIGQIIAPIFWMGLPILAVVSALAILFESVPILRGGFGNLVYSAKQNTPQLAAWVPRMGQNLIRRRKFCNTPSACGGDRNFQGFASLFFFLWIFTTTYFGDNMCVDEAGLITPVNDIYGITGPIASMQQQMVAAKISY